MKKQTVHATITDDEEECHTQIVAFLIVGTKRLGPLDEEVGTIRNESNEAFVHSQRPFFTHISLVPDTFMLFFPLTISLVRDSLLLLMNLRCLGVGHLFSMYSDMTLCLLLFEDVFHVFPY